MWSYLDTERVHKKTFTEIANEYGKEFPDDLRIEILGLQELDGATLIVNTLELDITPELFLEKAHKIEEKEMAKVELMHGDYHSDLELYTLYACL